MIMTRRSTLPSPQAASNTRSPATTTVSRWTKLKRSPKAMPAGVCKDSARLFREAHFVVGFQPSEERRLVRIEPELFAFLDEKFPLFRVLVIDHRVSLDAVAPLFDFLGRFKRAVLIQPLRHFLI